MEVGGDGDYIYMYMYICIYPSLHCHHQNDSCLMTGSEESHINVSLTVRNKVTRQCPQTTAFEEKGEPKRFGPGPSAYQPNALPLGQTGSQVRPRGLSSQPPPPPPPPQVHFWCCAVKQGIAGFNQHCVGWMRQHQRPMTCDQGKGLLLNTDTVSAQGADKRSTLC